MASMTFTITSDEPSLFSIRKEIFISSIFYKASEKKLFIVPNIISLLTTEIYVTTIILSSLYKKGTFLFLFSLSILTKNR